MRQLSGEQQNLGLRALWDRLYKWWFGFFIIGSLITSSATAAIVYVTDGNKIYSTDYNGQNITTLITGLSYACCLSVAENRIFWIDGYPSRKIRSAHTDGSSISDVITQIDPVSIAVNPNSRKLYWRDGTLKMINSSDLDGKNIVNIVNTTESGYIGIALDIVGGKIY